MSRSPVRRPSTPAARPPGRPIPSAASRPSRSRAGRTCWPTSPTLTARGRRPATTRRACSRTCSPAPASTRPSSGATSATAAAGCCAPATRGPAATSPASSSAPSTSTSCSRNGFAASRSRSARPGTTATFARTSRTPPSPTRPTTACARSSRPPGTSCASARPSCSAASPGRRAASASPSCAAVRLDLPMIVGPLPYAAGVRLELAYLRAIAAADPDADLRTRSLVVIEADRARRHAAELLPWAEALLVRLAPRHARLLAGAQDDDNRGCDARDESGGTGDRAADGDALAALLRAARIVELDPWSDGEGGGGELAELAAAALAVNPDLLLSRLSALRVRRHDRHDGRRRSQGRRRRRIDPRPSAVLGPPRRGRPQRRRRPAALPRRSAEVVPPDAARRRLPEGAPAARARAARLGRRRQRHPGLGGHGLRERAAGRQRRRHDPRRRHPARPGDRRCAAAAAPAPARACRRARVGRTSHRRAGARPRRRRATRRAHRARDLRAR